MTVTTVPVDVGSAEGDGTGDKARVAFQSVNTSVANLKAGAEALQGRFWTLDNTARSLALGERVVAETHAGIINTLPATFAQSATAYSDVWIWNADSDSDISLDPNGTDELFLSGTGQGAGVALAVTSGQLVICSPRVTDTSWDVLVLSTSGGRETIFVPAESMRSTVTNGATALADAETTAGNPDITGISFIAASDTYAQFKIEYPKRWNQGTLTFKASWESAATGTTGVAIALQAVAISDGDSYDTSFGTAIVVTDDAQSTAEDRYVTAESAAMTVAGTPADDDVIEFQVFRDVSDANDDMTEAMVLTGIRIFYTTSAGTDA